jgi:hypothetical protein
MSCPAGTTKVHVKAHDRCVNAPKKKKASPPAKSKPKSTGAAAKKAMADHKQHQKGWLAAHKSIWGKKKKKKPKAKPSGFGGGVGTEGQKKEGSRLRKLAKKVKKGKYGSAGRDAHPELAF